MPRRLLVLVLFATLAQLGSGCCHVRQRIANRWNFFHGGGGGACCTPAFRVPTPIRAFGGPAVGGLVYGGPVAGCASCAVPEVGPVAYAGPVGGPVMGPYSGPITGPYSGPPVISGPMPLHNPMVVPEGGPANPPKGSGN